MPLSVHLHDLWTRLHEREPHRTVLLQAGERPWTVSGLEARIQEWTDMLEGTRLRGRVVGFGLPNGADWLAVFLAILRSGGIAMPLDPQLKDPDAVVRASGGCAVIDPSGLRSWTSRSRALPRRICLVKLTSGSTGKPKPHYFTHAEMEADARQVQLGMKIGSEDINFASIPLGHSYGLGNFVVPMLRSGCPIALGRSILPRELLEDIADTRASVLPSVPPIIRALASADLPGDRLAGIRLVICAGSRLPGETAGRFQKRFDLPVHGFYGSTETGGISYDITGTDTARERSAGHPLPGVRIARAASGRLEVASAAVHSFHNSRNRRSGDPSVLLPDHGRILDDGSIALEHRKRGFIKRGGRRISLGETESVALALSGVSQAWAYALKRDNGDEDLGIVLETSLPSSRVRTWLRDELSIWKRPARVLCMSRFPQTARGKPDTGRLRELAGLDRNP